VTGDVRRKRTDSLKKPALEEKVAGGGGDIVAQQLKGHAWEKPGFLQLLEIVLLVGVRLSVRVDMQNFRKGKTPAAGLQGIQQGEKTSGVVAVVGVEDGQVFTASQLDAAVDGGMRDLVVDYEYDAYGRVIKQTVPYDTNVGNDDYKGQSLNFQPVTSTSYDVLGRPLQVIGTDGLVQRSMTYDGLTTTLRDSKNQATTQTVDVWGLRPWSGRQPARRRSTATTGSTG